MLISSQRRIPSIDLVISLVSVCCIVDSEPSSLTQAVNFRSLFCPSRSRAMDHPETPAHKTIASTTHNMATVITIPNETLGCTASDTSYGVQTVLSWEETCAVSSFIGRVRAACRAMRRYSLTAFSQASSSESFIPHASLDPRCRICSPK